MNVAPSASYETVMNWGVTGATLGVTLKDNVGGITQARVTTGITEIDPGVYARTMTAPATAGQFSIVWDDTVDFATDDLFVTGAVAAVGGTGNLYVSRDEIKKAGSLVGETFADDDIDVVIAAASRACDSYRRDISPFYPSTATRYYTPNPALDRVLIDALNTLTTVSVDDAADYTYAGAWTQGVEFWLEPTNSFANGEPYLSLALIPSSSSRFLRHPRSLRIVGSFGWAETPIMVKQAAKEYALFMLNKTRNAPLAIVLAEATTAARTGAIDRNVAFLLDQIMPRPQLTSVQLG